MVKHKHIDLICIGAMLLAVLFTVGLLRGMQSGAYGEEDGIKEDGIKENSVKETAAAYAFGLFDAGRVHTIDIQMEDFPAFTENAGREEYVSCTAVIDGEEFRRVGIRTKGNNSLRLTGEYGLSRYSLKLEFDHYADGGNYYGLDKLSLDASFQDNSYLKNYMVYDMMAFMGVPAPLCSYVWVTVNGQDWGLFLAVEEPEEAFVRRNYGNAYGKLYKPDYRSLKEENADVALQYIDGNPDSYPGIFENARFPVSEADKRRLIEALRILSSGEGLDRAVCVDEVLRYFTVQVFVMNWDSYIGPTGHNYFLYEENGILSILPWDYNLAFGTYALGMTNPVKDPEVLINYPIYTPAEGDIMRNRPLYHNLMKQKEYFVQYQAYFDELLTEYFENGRFEAVLRQTERMIAPYVQKDPTAFCSYEDHRKAVDMLERICLLRAESIRGQLDGNIPATLRGQQANPGIKTDTSSVCLTDLGDFDDLESAKERQTTALERIEGYSPGQ